MARRGSATFKGDYISSKLPRVSQYFVSDIPSRGNGLQKPWQKHDQTKHHQDHIWHCVPRCVRFRIPWGAEFPRCLMQVGESLELLEAIVHAADISNPCKSQTHIGNAKKIHWTPIGIWNPDQWIPQDLKIFGRDHEFVWISEAETNDALLDAKSTLSERAASLCFFNPYQSNQQFWKVMQRIKKIYVILFICRFCRGTITMFSQYVDTMFCINL